jgi:hypothetical protein
LIRAGERSETVLLSCSWASESAAIISVLSKLLQLRLRVMQFLQIEMLGASAAPVVYCVFQQPLHAVQLLVNLRFVIPQARFKQKR